MDLRWNDWNIDHFGAQGVAPEEAEQVVRGGLPMYRGDDKYLVQGRGSGGRWLQVIYVLEKQSDVDFESIVSLDWTTLQTMPDAKIARVIHAMDLTREMKRQLRRRRR